MPDLPGRAAVRMTWPAPARILLAVIALVLLGLLVAGGALWWLARAAEPQYAGELALPGLAAPVTVRFGPQAVPTIQAASVDDLMFAQGYVVAAERMWQMDLLRRLASGRLAEVFGPAALTADRYHRTIGLPAAARAGLAALEPEYRQMLRRYADGVNAYREQAKHRLPLEYRLAGFTPAPWEPADSLVIGEYMAWINAVNLREELTFLRLASRLGTARALALFPTDLGLAAPADALDLPDYHGLTAAVPAEVGEPAPPFGPWLAQTGSGTAASNAWAVTGKRSADGTALLANDPHLAPSLPSIWYLLELIAPGLHVAGAALPGVPLVLIGHNQDLAWGITAAVADVQDLFVERLTADGAGVLRPNGAVEPITSRTEEIGVAGWASPETHVIRSSSHGVLIDALVAAPGANPDGLPVVPLAPDMGLALATMLGKPERAVAGLWQLNTATTVAAARGAILAFRHAPLSLLIAHRDGGLGWQVGGLLPQRARGSGAFPAPGWEAGFGWTGAAPVADNPGLSNPPEQRLISANQRMLPPDAAERLGHAWLPPFRARRIGELLDAAAPLTLADMGAMQADRVSVEARLALAALDVHLPALRQLDAGLAQRAERAFAGWDFGFDPASRPAALFALLKPALYQALYGDELGAADLRLLMALDTSNYGPLAETLADDASPFWDDVTTPTAETPALIWGRALRAALSDLDAALPAPADQRLDRLRTLTFPHAFDANPTLARWFNIGPIGMGGDSSTINVAGAGPLHPRTVGHIPSLRVVFSPADWGATRGTLPLGQSGHRLSRYRADQLPRWLAGESASWPWDGPAAGDLLGTLRLLPAP